MSGEGTKKKTPVLSWAMSLYYSQGLPFSLVRQVSVVFFRDQGASLEHLGYVSLYGMPWTLKFLWGPLIDRLSTKRRWIVAMEFLLALIFAFMANAVGHGASMLFVAGLFFIVAVFAATHDIAVDGFYLETLDKPGQAKFSGWIVAAYRLALLSGSGLLVALSGQWPWWAIFAIVSVYFFGITLWHRWVLPPPLLKEKLQTSEKRMPGLEGFQTFFQLPGIGLAVTFIILFKLGDALLFGMSTPFLLDIGLSKEKLGLISGGFGVASAILASIAGGWFISKYSLRRGLYLFGVIQNFAIPVYAFVAWTHPPTWVLGVAVVVEQISAGLGTAAYTNFVMRQNNPQYRATHYAVATGLMALTTTLGGVISGHGAKNFGYPIFFVLAFFASVPGLCLIPFVARRPECQ